MTLLQLKTCGLNNNSDNNFILTKYSTLVGIVWDEGDVVFDWNRILIDIDDEIKLGNKKNKWSNMSYKKLAIQRRRAMGLFEQGKREGKYTKKSYLQRKFCLNCGGVKVLPDE